jgi:hypothetical protein
MEDYNLILQETNGVTDTSGTSSKFTTFADDEGDDIINNWDNEDSGSGVSSYLASGPAGSTNVIKLTTVSAGAGNYARRATDVGTFGDRVVIKTSVYCDAVGTLANGDIFGLIAYHADCSLQIAFTVDGLFVYDGAEWNEVGTDLVIGDQWQRWVFDIDFSTPATATCDVYLDEVLVASSVDCSDPGSYTSGLVKLVQYGITAANRLSYVDYIQVGDGGVFIQNTNYYVTVKRDESVGTYGTLYCYIYSNLDRSTLVDTLTVTLTEKQNFQYLFGMISYDGVSGGNDWDGTISNLGNHPWLVLRETNGVVDTEVESALLSVDTDYWLTLERDESQGAFGELYCHIYSDSNRATLVETLTGTLTEKQDFRYIFAMISWDDATTTNTWDGTISNLTGAIYYDILSGYHFKKDQPPETHVLVQAQTETGTSAIFNNKTAIPDQGNFEDDALYTDSTGAARGRFVSAPQGNVVYCNDVESMIWGGDESRCAAFILSTAAITNTVTNARDFTEQIQNTLTDSDEVAAIATPYMRGVIGSTRPLKGVKLYVLTPNDTTSTLAFEEWTGTAWSGLTETDNTSSGGIALAQTGTVTWPTTESTSKVKYLEGRVLYWYQWVLSAGSATISHVTVDAPFQKIKNIWSGDPSTIAACKKYDTSVYYDYTVEVNDAITTTVAVLNSLGTTHSALFGFLNPQQGFEVFIPPGKGNGDANTLSVKYWDGDSFEALSAVNDGTSDGTASLAKSGVISFTPPDRGTEFPTTISQEGPYYYYQLMPVTAAMDAETEIYYITGIPAPEKVPAHKFAVNFQTRTLLCSPDESPEAVLVSAENAPDVYNGLDSTTLYFGGHDDLIAGTGLYNRHGSSIYNMAVLCKQTETWILTGYNPETFEKNQISSTVGCVAPLRAL